MKELLRLLHPEYGFFDVKEPGPLVRAIRKPLSTIYKVFTSPPKETICALIRYLKGELDDNKYYGDYKK